MFVATNPFAADVDLATSNSWLARTSKAGSRYEPLMPNGSN